MFWIIQLKLLVPIAAMLVRNYAVRMGNNLLMNAATVVFFLGIVIFFLDPFWKKRF
jgi:predicted membrane protein